MQLYHRCYCFIILYYVRYTRPAFYFRQKHEGKSVDFIFRQSIAREHYFFAVCLLYDKHC